MSGPAGVRAQAPRRAGPGETVWVFVSVVWPQRREEFLDFVREVNAPAARAVKPEAYATMRLLEPTQPNADGTWSFVWLMDPVLPGEDYELQPVLEGFYGPRLAAEHLRHWQEMQVGDQLFYEVTQTAPADW